jgi:hypothetical protein
MNAFAVQVLATAVGDPARFRQPQAAEPDVRDLERNAMGFPLDGKERSRHIAARTWFMEIMRSQLPDDEWIQVVKKCDAEDPSYYVEWARRRREAESISGFVDSPGWRTRRSE